MKILRYDRTADQHTCVRSSVVSPHCRLQNLDSGVRVRLGLTWTKWRSLRSIPAVTAAAATSAREAGEDKCRDPCAHDRPLHRPPYASHPHCPSHTPGSI